MAGDGAPLTAKRVDRRGLALCALAGAIPIALHAVRTFPRFDGLYGQDAYAYFAYAIGPLLDSLRGGAPLPPFHWPPGYPLAVACASLAVGPSPLAGQLASAAAGLLVPVLTFLLAREVWRPPEAGGEPGVAVPLLSGLLVGFTPQLGQSSVVVMSDTTSLAAAALGTVGLTRYVRGLAASGGAANPGWLLLAAAALAFAVLTRWSSALVALVAVGYAGLATAPYARERPRRLALHALAALAVALLVLAPILGPTLASLSGRGTPTDHTVDLDVVLTTWNPANAFRSTFENSDGLQRHATSNLTFYLLAPARHALLTPVFALFLPVGLLRVLASRRVAPLLLLVAWPAVVAAFVIGISWQNFRYTLTMLPPLAILAALGIEGVWRRAAGRGRALVGALVVLGFVWMAVANDRLTARFVERKNDTLGLLAWTLERIPDDAVLVTFSVTTAFRHYGKVEVRELYALDDAAVDDLLAGGRPLFVLVDRAGVEGQWAALSPGHNLSRLEARGGLVAVGQRAPFTLYEAAALDPGPARDSSPAEPGASPRGPRTGAAPSS